MLYIAFYLYRVYLSPVYKKGDERDQANYRPISLTCILCKVMEHLIASNLTRHLDKHEFYTVSNMGFSRRGFVRPSWSS